jgi:hypothetical protein
MIMMLHGETTQTTARFVLLRMVAHFSQHAAHINDKNEARDIPLAVLYGLLN